MCLSYGFSFQEFLLYLFYCQKMAFVEGISAYVFVQNDIFLKVSCLMDMRFCGHVPNSQRNKNLESVEPYSF
jgi:hypothetical protein